MTSAGAPAVRSAAARDGGRRLRIAVWHNLPSGGGKRALYQHVRGLVGRGHDVESWTLATADAAYLPLSELVPEHVVPFALDDRSLAARARRATGATATAQRIARMHAACAQCAREMRAHAADVVFAAPCRAFLVPFIGLHAEAPTVAYVQEPNRALYEAGHSASHGGMLPWAAGPAGPGAVARLRRAVDRASLARIAREEWRAAHAVDRLLVNSRYSRESFLRAFAVDSAVCYLGVDAEQFVDTDAPRDGFVAGLGSFHPAKGIELAVRALALIPEPRPALVWIGNSSDPGYLADVLRIATTLGVDLQPRLRVPDSEVVALLGRAAALVYTPRLEPFGFAPLEANACGTPVVGVAEAGVRETIQEGVNGFLVDNRDPAAIAAALGRLLDNPELARAMGRRGRALVRDRWTVDRSVDCVEQHLFAAVERR